jgi:hypothetical protein
MSVLVWDFDHSLINDNTDTWYSTALAPHLAQHYDRSRQWTDLMDEQMGRLQGLGFRSQQIRACFHSIPMVRVLLKEFSLFVGVLYVCQQVFFARLCFLLA